jgi:hypothetical protein
LYSVLKKEGRMPSNDRERSFENALARHLRAGGAAGDPRSTCSDAETLAAYHERSLAPEQMASLKTHVTHCERCQQILAHLEATDEISVPATDLARQATAAAKSSVPFPARQPSFWRWVAPAGALAAALLVWVAVHENNSVRIPVQATRVDQKQTEIAKDRPASSPQLTLPSLDATRKREAASPDSFSALKTSPRSQTAAAPKPPDQSRLKQKDSLSPEKKSSVADDFNQLADNSPNGSPPTAWDEDLKSQRPGGVTQNGSGQNRSRRKSGERQTWCSFSSLSSARPRLRDWGRACSSSRATPCALTGRRYRIRTGVRSRRAAARDWQSVRG